MDNTTIPAKIMVPAKAIKDPLNEWAMIGSDKWKYDLGLRRFLNDEQNGKGNYYFSDKRGKRLWDLLTYMDEDTAILVLEYYHLPDPEHFIEFLKWAYNHVQPDNAWKCPKDENQMCFFPYKALWLEWSKGLSGTFVKAENITAG